MAYSANDSEYVGWWAKTNIYGAKVCSRKWKLAAEFANYFSVSYKVREICKDRINIVKDEFDLPFLANTYKRVDKYINLRDQVDGVYDGEGGVYRLGFFMIVYSV